VRPLFKQCHARSSNGLFWSASRNVLTRCRISKGGTNEPLINSRGRRVRHITRMGGWGGITRPPLSHSGQNKHAFSGIGRDGILGPNNCRGIPKPYKRQGSNVRGEVNIWCAVGVQFGASKGAHRCALPALRGKAFSRLFVA
jgi:hypothetical protein